MNHLSLFSKIILSMSLFSIGWQTGMATTPIKTLSVQEIALPTSGISQQHNLAKTADGRLILSWVEKDEQSSTVRFSIRDNNTWLPVKTVHKAAGKLGAPPVVLALSDGTLAAAWMPYIPNSASRYAANIYLVKSQDGGSTWSDPLMPYAESARIYDAQMSLKALSNGKLALVWTDMRHTSTAKDHDKKADRYQLMATVIDKQWRAGDDITLDNDVCSCCSVFTDAQGDDLVTVYRDRRAGEIRDTSAVRWNPKSVNSPILVHEDHWHIEGCPSNGPAVSLSKTHAAVAWFSAADGHGRVKLSFSHNRAKHFAAPIEIDTNASGYVNALLLNKNAALVIWRGRVGAEDELRIAKVSQNGKITQQTTLYKGSFPKWPSRHLSLERIGNTAFIAWTDPLLKKVRLVAIALSV